MKLFLYGVFLLILTSSNHCVARGGGSAGGTGDSPPRNGSSK
ncbi:hypothetical protein EZJ49_12145 [Bdellovibrio bacteriovorus]|nr:hypothetical protein [Bdellovibrio bacteriovorus]UXR63813.1 hypothetical protein EZJ49_12145 [Bdellovibrio bacteriovorus]